MKHLTKIAAVTLMLATSVTYAQQAERSVATIDAGAGKGGFSITVSVPKSDGPFDFAKNPGPRVSTDNGNTYGELLFAANVSDTSVATYRVAVFRDDKANERKKPYTAEVLAQEIIKSNGFVGRAIKSECPTAAPDGFSMVCYKMHGYSTLGFDSKNWATAISIASYSFKNNTQGFVFIGSAVEKDKAKYSADPTMIEKKADSKLNSLITFSKFND